MFEKIINENLTYKELKAKYNITTQQLQNAKKYAKRYCPKLLDQIDKVNLKIKNKYVDLPLK